MNLVETMSTDEEGMEILLKDMGVVSSGKLAWRWHKGSHSMWCGFVSLITSTVDILMLLIFYFINFYIKKDDDVKRYIHNHKISSGVGIFLGFIVSLLLVNIKALPFIFA